MNVINLIRVSLRQKQSSDTRRKNIHKMSKNHSTEERVCAVDTLHARVFGVRRAAANEGIFIPHLVLYVLRPNCPDATAGKSLVRGGQRCIANGNSQSGYRRHVDSTPIREGAGQYHSARPCQKAHAGLSWASACWAVRAGSMCYRLCPVLSRSPAIATS